MQQNACMPVSITVRDVPDEVRDELAARAARAGMSLTAYLRNRLVEAATREDVESVLRRARERVARTESRLPATAILDHLAEERS
jgi:plasmid stability protein